MDNAAVAHKTSITMAGIELLYNRAFSRGYEPYHIYIGLKMVL